MLTLFVKISAGTFFAYVAVDSFFRMKKIRLEMQDGQINPVVGRPLRSQALRHGIQFTLMSLLSFASIWVTVGPLAD